MRWLKATHVRAVAGICLVWGAVVLAAEAPPQAATPGASAAAPDGLEVLRRGLRQAYRYVIEGNTRDLERHRTAVARLAQRLREAPRRPDDPQGHAVQQLGYLYGLLAQNNAAILAGFDRGDLPAVYAAMDQVLFLEQEVQRAGGTPAEREWLTFQELARCQRLGWKCRPPPPGVLPLAKALWTAAEESVPVKPAGAQLP